MRASGFLPVWGKGGELKARGGRRLRKGGRPAISATVRARVVAWGGGLGDAEGDEGGGLDDGPPQHPRVGRLRRCSPHPDTPPPNPPSPTTLRPQDAECARRCTWSAGACGGWPAPRPIQRKPPRARALGPPSLRAAPFAPARRPLAPLGPDPISEKGREGGGLLFRWARSRIRMYSCSACGPHTAHHLIRRKADDILGPGWERAVAIGEARQCGALCVGGGDVVEKSKQRKRRRGWCGPVYSGDPP